jgi:predicted GNAT superfamily acetyltransferase
MNGWRQKKASIFMPDFSVRLLDKPAEFEGCVEIQRRVWNHPDLDITPIHNFCASVEMGGIVLGAYAGREMAGYAYSFPAVVHGRLAQHSHHLAVRTEYQGHGLGKTLKWAQREEALRRGFKLITWTYDPLQARNANLNLHTLGASGRTYFENFYGPTPALKLEEGVPTDRLLMEWPIASARVARRRNGAPAALDPALWPKAVERRADGAYPDIHPKRPRNGRTDKRILIEIPKAVRDLKGRAGLIAAWQKAIRSAFLHYFRAGWRADDFIFGERCFYVLKKASR